MVDPQEQKLAKANLESRDVEFSVGYLFVKNFRIYLIASVIFAPLLALLYYQDLFLYFHLLFGIFVGYGLRDLAWYRVIAHTRPFTLKVMDWEKVRRIAEGEPVD